ncbi:MAG: DegT/DnrJ/EryC1/StrS family aminotransferase [Bacteroidales bacterium]
MKIPLTKPFMNDEIRDRVMEVLESGYLTEGPVTRKLESVFSEYIGCRHSIAVTSCTAGLEIALRCLGIGPGDEVIVPDYTYPGTVTVAPNIGATSVFVDIDKSTMLIDYDAIEEAITPRTKAIIPVSEFGNPLNYDKLNELKEKYGLYIIEDAACSIGAEFNGIKTGNQADISVFSLHPRKFITTGEGGMITTNNSQWAEWIDSYKHFGISKSKVREDIHFEMIGINSKMSDVLAAIGYGQMLHVDELLENRHRAVKNYLELLKNVKGVSIPRTTEGGKHSYQSFAIFVENREQILKTMRAEGVEVQIGTYALHMHKAFKESPLCRVQGEYPGSRFALDNCLALPLYNDITLGQQKIVVEKLVSLFNY